MLMNWVWNSWVRGGLLVVAVIGAVLLGGLLWEMATGGWRSYSKELDAYQTGVVEGDEDAVTNHICPEAWSQIAALDEGVDEAREETLRALPGPIEDIGARRGSEDRAVLELSFPQDSVLYELPVVWIEDKPRFCPSSPLRLLGSPL